MSIHQLLARAIMEDDSYGPRFTPKSYQRTEVRPRHVVPGDLLTHPDGRLMSVGPVLNRFEWFDSNANVVMYFATVMGHASLFRIDGNSEDGYLTVYRPVE